MTIDTRIAGGIAVLDLRESLNDRNSKLAERITQLLAAGEKRILVTTCQKQGAELKLVNPRDAFLKVLQDTHMTFLFAVYSNEVEACSAFR